MCIHNIFYHMYTMFRAQADWTLVTSYEGAPPLAEKNAATRLELLAHIVYFFH
jgi:hypothetical protein